MDFMFPNARFLLTNEAYIVILCTCIIQIIIYGSSKGEAAVLKRGITDGTETERFTCAAGPVRPGV